MILSGVLITLSALNAQAGTINGQIQTASGGPVRNGVLTLTLNQVANIPGTAQVVAQQVQCFSDNFGNLVGEPDQTTPPAASINLGVGTLPAGTYFVKTALQDASGVSNVSPEASFTLSAPGTLIVTAPGVQPANASGFRIYIGTASGNETLQGTVTGTPGSWANFSQSAALSAGSAMPVSNTTVCTFAFQDSMIPTTTYYTINLVNAGGSKIAGYPISTVRFFGGTNGSVNISNGWPISFGGVIYPTPIISTPAANATQSIAGALSLGTFAFTAGNGTFSGTLGVTGTSTLANVSLGVANTLSLSNIKQVSATTAFALTDNLGVSHFFIAGTSPFTNTFVSGNGSGGVFLGSAAKAFVSDTTGAITTAGGLTLQTTAQTLSATVANDASGGVTTTSNGGNSLQWNNSGVLIVNPAATSSGAALTVGGISPTTGGASIFIGASGAANEVGALYPADGSTAKFRARGLSIRNLSAGLLTGTEVFAISSSGVVTGGTLTGATTGNNVSVLNAQGAIAALTGNSADQVVYTYSLPANTVDTTSKGILITCGLTHNSGTANPSVKININGVAAVTGSIGTSASQSVTTEAKIIRTASTTGGSIGKATSAGNLVPFTQSLAGLAWTSSQTITCTFNVANTDQMTGVAFWVEQIQ